MASLKKYLRFFIPATLAILLWILSWGLARINMSEPNYISLSESISDKFIKKEKTLIQVVDELSVSEDVFSNFNAIIHTLSNNETRQTQLAFFVFDNKELLLWSSNIIPIDGFEEQILRSNQQLIKLSNGYYYCVTRESGELTIAGLLPVFYQYPYENRYLKNGYASFFGKTNNLFLGNSADSGFAILNINGDYIFSVETDSEASRNTVPFIWIFLFFLGSVTFFFIFLSRVLFKKQNSPLFVIPVMVLLVLILRYLQIRFFFPWFLYSDALFSPVHYAWNIWFASLGDLLAHAYCFLFLSIFFYTTYNNKARYVRFSLRRIVLLIFLSVVLLFLFIGTNVIVETLIINSTLLLSFDDILKLKFVDFSGLLIVILTPVAFVYFSTVFFQLIRKNLKIRKEIFTILFVTIILFSIFALIFSKYWIQIVLFIFFFIVVVGLKRRFFKISGAFGIISLLLFTFSFGQLMNKVNKEKEHSFRNLYAIQLSSEQDPIGEYLFEEVAGRIVNDQNLADGLSFSEEPQVFAEEYLRRYYLGGYFSKYHIQVTLCKPRDYLFLVHSELEVPCADFFSSLKMNFGTPTMVPDYWLIDDSTGRPNYLYETRFENTHSKGTDTIFMFLEMIAIPKINVVGYPELLVEEKIIRKTRRFDYTYAKYFNRELISQYGDYHYSLILGEHMNKHDITFLSHEDYSHMIYPVDAYRTIVVSIPEKKLFENAATFSYLLLLFAVFHYLFFLFTNLIQREPLLSLFAFKTRLQSASIFLVILSFIVAGVITVNFFIKYHNNKNREIMREKSYSLLVELEHKLRNYESLGHDDTEYLNELMAKFSNVFFTDINLFSTSGRLIATSRPQVYQQGLISSYINPGALSSLKESNTPYLMQNESIGKLNYTSSYLPFKNFRGDVIAYLNLPYFARENELKTEISSFLIAFINFYVFLIALAIIIALVIANYITLPLRIIGEKLRTLKPGKPNEKIQWNKQDDIGILISEYNRMVDELSDSTRLLMKTERESAWREMAKQIAHEIKNPLTPMKLSLQNLQRAWEDKAPDYEQRLKRTSQTLIEQIDALSNIASAFANFANLQEAKFYPVNLVPIMKDIVHLNENNLIHFDLKYNDALSYVVLGDDTQIIQIMNNLIKNAVQSIPPRDAGDIEISLEKAGGKIFISIKDNGCGISEDIKEKIFSPNFTSKSGGTGLGLAITKKLTDSMNGSISFVSEVNKGSVFYLSFPEFCDQDT